MAPKKIKQKTAGKIVKNHINQTDLNDLPIEMKHKIFRFMGNKDKASINRGPAPLNKIQSYLADTDIVTNNIAEKESINRLYHSIFPKHIDLPYSSNHGGASLREMDKVLDLKYTKK